MMHNLTILGVIIGVLMCFERGVAIKNGIESKPGQWPFMAALFSSNGGVVCTGIVWNERTILSAANCIDSSSPSFAYLGNNDVSQIDQTFVFGIVKVHNYNHHDFALDNIVLLELNSTIDFSGLHSSVRCVKNPLPQVVLKMGNCLTIGWGWAPDIHNSDPVTKLRHAETSMQSPQICAEKAKQKLLFTQDRHLCALNDKNGGTFCYKDEGGPLMCPLVDEPNQFILAGVASNPIFCEENDGKNPGFYSKLDYYYGWIVDKAGEVCSYN